MAYSLLVKQASIWGGAGTMGRGQMNIDECGSGLRLALPLGCGNIVDLSWVGKMQGC